MTYTLPSVHEVRPVAEGETIAIRGELDPAGVIALQRRVSDALDTGHRRIVIDLSAAGAPGPRTSLMLGGALRRLTSRGATVAVVAGAPGLCRVLELCAIEGLALHPRR